MINVLVIDDDNVDVLALRRAFNKHEVLRHASLSEAKNGRDALALLTGNHPLKPNLVLLDINMPGMNGLQFLDTVRSSPNLSNLRVIVLTTSADNSDIKAANAKCIVGYITKAKAGNYAELANLVSSYCTLTEL
jgi:CheY-like chemotaxis protein